MVDLYEAAKTGDISALESLDPRLLLQKNAVGDSPLHVAAKNKQYEWIRHLIKKNLLTTEGILLPDNNQANLGHLLIATNQAELIDYCYKKCVAEKKLDALLFTPNAFYETAWELKKDTAVQVLIKNETFPTKYNKNYSPLYQAIQRDNLLLIQQLAADNSISPFLPYKREYEGDQPLLLAARTGKTDILIALLKSRDETMIKIAAASNNNSWLHLVMSSPNKDTIVTKLVAEKVIHSVDVTSLDENGNTPLHLAAYSGDLDSLKQLLPLADPDTVNILNVRGNSWLHELAMSDPEKFLALVKTGLISKESLNQKNTKGETCAHLFAKQGYGEMLLALLDQGLDLLVTNHLGDTPLHTAAKHYQGHLILEFANKGLITQQLLNKQNNHGDTLLHHMLFAVDIEVAEKLLQLGADLHISDKDGRSPLIYLYESIYYSTDKDKNAKLDYLKNYAVSEPFKISADFLNKFFTMHQLYFVFGGQKLIEKFEKTKEFFPGGITKNVLPLFEDAIRKFSSLQDPDKEKHFNKILQLLASYHEISELEVRKDQAAKNLLADNVLLTETGFIGHTIGVTLEKHADEVILTMAERGAWAEKNEDQKTVSVKSLRFPANQNNIELVIELLNKAKNSPQHLAKEIIFYELPKKLDAIFKPENSIGNSLICKLFKDGICFYSNFKTVIHDWFIKELGLSPDNKNTNNLKFLCAN